MQILEKVKNVAMRRWREESNTRDLFENDFQAFVDESVEVLLRETWKANKELHSVFFGFENFKAYALAELSGRAEPPEGIQSLERQYLSSQLGA